jgi:5'-methylthioadenosine phosphorylase
VESILALIGGTSLLYSDLPALTIKRVPTPYGPAEVLCGDILVLLRHRYQRPPHRINHRANLAALALLGADRIVAIGSVGSLKLEIHPGSLMIPDDYLSFYDIPSFHEHAIVHVRPGLSPGLAQALAEVTPDARPGGVYVQTRGPRIETMAEVRALALEADVVGMTLASEATLAAELGIEFCALCTIENYANGIGEEVLTYDHILACARENADRTTAIVDEIIRRL